MFPIEQTTKQQATATGFAINQANYVNLTSARDKELFVYITIQFSDGSKKDDTIIFSGEDYNSANTAFATWKGIINFIEEKLGVTLSIPENIEEMFQNLPPPPPEKERQENINDNPQPVSESEVPSKEPVSLPSSEESVKE